MVGTLTSACILKSPPDCLEGKSDALFTSLALYLFIVLPPSPHQSRLQLLIESQPGVGTRSNEYANERGFPVPPGSPARPALAFLRWADGNHHRCPLSNVGIFAFGKHIPATKWKVLLEVEEPEKGKMGLSAKQRGLRLWNRWAPAFYWAKWRTKLYGILERD